MSRDQIPREFAAQLGEEAVRVGARGFYMSPSGTRVEIMAEKAHAVKGRVSTNQMHEVPAIMWSRILKVLALGLAQGHDAIVLGAWGCGAFGPDAEEISKLFRRGVEENFRGAYKEAAFAILDWSPERRFIGPFERRFQDFSR